MSKDVRTDVEEKMSELRAQLDSLGSEDETVSSVVPSPPDLPSEHELDGYESLYVDAILWREDSAQTKQKLAKLEMEACRLMRQNLMTKLVARLGVNPETHTVSVNQDTRKATVIKR